MQTTPSNLTWTSLVTSLNPVYNYSTNPLEGLWGQVGLKLGRHYPLHWFRFPPIPRYQHSIFAAMVFIIGLIGIPENLYVLYLFATEKSLHSPSNLIIMSLSLADLSILVSNCPLNFVSGLYGRWVFGEIGCDVYGFSGTVFGLTSINTIALIAVDRLYSVMTSLQMKKISYTMSTIYISGVWVYCVGWGILPFVGISEYVLEGFLTTCTVNYISDNPKHRLYSLLLFIFCYLLPLTIILGTYVKIFTILNSHQREMKVQVAKMASSDAKLATKKFNKSIKMAKIAMYLTTGYLIAWTPYSIVYLMGLIGYSDHVSPLLSMLPAIFAKSAGIYNPIIYVASHEKFKDALMRRFGILKAIRTAMKDNRNKHTTTRDEISCSNDTSVTVQHRDVTKSDFGPGMEPKKEVVKVVPKPTTHATVTLKGQTAQTKDKVVGGSVKIKAVTKEVVVTDAVTNVDVEASVAHRAVVKELSHTLNSTSGIIQPERDQGDIPMLVMKELGAKHDGSAVIVTNESTDL